MPDRDKIEAIWKPLETGGTAEVEKLLKEGVNIKDNDGQTAIERTLDKTRLNTLAVVVKHETPYFCISCSIRKVEVLS